jgi:hypothetical protein
LSSVTVAHADSKKADITIDKNLAMKVSSSICIRQQEASDMPVTIKRKDLEKWQLKGCRPVERLPAKTDLSADDTRPSAQSCNGTDLHWVDISLWKRNIRGSETLKSQDDTIHDLPNLIRRRRGNLHG